MHPQETLSRNIVLGEILARNSRKYPNKAALLSEGRQLAYGEFNERVNRIAHAMQDIGIARGEKIALLLFNSIELIECCFAAAKLGAVAVPLNCRLVGHEIAYILNDSDARALIYAGNFHEQIAGIRDQLPGVREFIGVSAPGGESWSRDYGELLSKGSPDEPLSIVDDDDPAQILYTSGTTGKHKGAVLTHKNLFMGCISINYAVGSDISPDDIYLCVAPLFHIGGMIMTLQMIHLGGTVVIHRQFDPAAIARSIQDQRTSFLFLVPAMCLFLLMVPGLAELDLSSVRTIIHGGSIMPTELKKQLIAAFPGARIYDVFGQTEGGMTMLSPEDSLRKQASVGRATVELEFRVVDDEDRDLPPGQVGEVVYRGPVVMREYYKKPEATAQAKAGGWFHSGDLGRMDAEGFLYIVDRKQDMIVSGGENVYPAEVEEVLSRHEKIQEVAVIGRPSEQWGETVHAFVVQKPGEPLTEEELLSFSARFLAGFKRPKSVDFIQALPRNAVGKVLKTELRKKYGSAIMY